MMNNVVDHSALGVPVNSLAGITSLSSLLPSLPVPQAMPEMLPWNKSLLFHTRVVEEAKRYLATPDDDALVTHLVKVLSLTNSDHIVLQDRYNFPHQLDGPLPELIQSVIAKDPMVFHGGQKTVQHNSITNNHYASPHSSFSSPQQPGPSSAPQALPRQAQVSASPASAAPGSVQSARSSSPDGVAREFQFFWQLYSEPQVKLEPLSEIPEVCQDDIKQHQRAGKSSEIAQTPEEREAMRKQIVSIGKQPKAHKSRRKDMVSELFDSLTPAAEYFDVEKRRSRGQPKAYTDEEFEKPKAAADDEPDQEEVKSSSKRKHKRRGSEEPPAPILLDRPVTPTEVIEEREKQWQQILKKRKEKLKRRSEQIILDADELVETETYRKFISALDGVFDNIEEYAGPADVGEDDEEIPAECLIPRSILNDLCSEAQKLKAMSAMNKVPIERLVKLMSVLEKNIRDGAKLVPPAEDDDDEDETFRELMADRVIRSVDSALTALTIMTSPQMPKLVYIEDCIERCLLLTKFQLTNVIYPAFDPCHRINKKESSSKKRPKTGSVKNKSMQQLYNKMVEITGGLAELVEIQSLTDTIILQLASLGVAPFFVENISELQLSALRLVANVFSKYDHHRQHILDDILSSLARLPSSKRSMRSYRLNAEEYIQMVTALVMQLIQSVVTLPSSKSRDQDDDEDDESAQLLLADNRSRRKVVQKEQDKDVLIFTSYDASLRTAQLFLSVYLKKCTTKSEDDYRPLFEAFVEDLLASVNKPEWPAAEVLLSILGRLLVQHFSSKQIDMSLRVASLDYLGVVAARLRKDAVSTQLDELGLNQIIRHLTEASGDDEKPLSSRKKPVVSEAQKFQILQKALIDYLIELKDNDPSLEFAKEFYIAQWFRDCLCEMEKARAKPPPGAAKKAGGSAKDEPSHEQLQERALEQANATKQFLFSLIDREQELQAASGSKFHSNQYDQGLNEESAAFVVRYLATKRPFSQSFDIYLSQILRVLTEPAIAVRTKAMKCLSTVVEADPAILERADMQGSVYARLLDSSANVREAAVDLLGKFILVRPKLINKYYGMLAERILDKGVSVRKRVIKILKDVCVEMPEFEKIPEICAKIIGRIDDEDGVRKLVNEVFHSLWFVPLRDRDTDVLQKKVVSMTDVVSQCRETGYEWFETLLSNLFKKDADKQVLIASRQIVKSLVDTVLGLEEKLSGTETVKNESHRRLLSCLTTLYLFSKVKPSLMVAHVETIEPYLCMNCNTQGEQAVLVQVVRILEMVVPLMDHPSPTFLARIEEGLLKLVFKCGASVVQACIACLAATIKQLTQNYKLVIDSFTKFFSALMKIKAQLELQAPGTPLPLNLKPSLLRALFTVGLLCRYFDFDDPKLASANNSTVPLTEQTFDAFLFFTQFTEEDVQQKAYLALGMFCVSNCGYFMKKEVKDLYHNILETASGNMKMNIQVLQNIELYLKEEDSKMAHKDHDVAESTKKKEHDDLKDMCDISSGMASTIIQLYLNAVLEAFFCANTQVRQASASVIMLTLQQGLVHPVQCIPYLIAMSTEPEATIRIKADNMLKEIDSKHGGFIQMSAVAGIKKSFALQRLVWPSVVAAPQAPSVQGKAATIPVDPMAAVVRGLRPDDDTQALNGYLYTLIRSNRQQRRGLLQSLLKLFDENSKTPMEELIYVADNLACFPYQTVEEPLYVMHNIDLNVAVYGSNLLQTFKENLIPRPKPFVPEGQDPSAANEDEYDDEETPEDVYDRLPLDSLQVLQDCIACSQGCVLLLQLKQFLKNIYGLSDSKVHQYNPSESAKTYDKPLNRKQDGTLKFVPSFALHYVTVDMKEQISDEEHKRKLCKQYIDFKQLMMSIDATSASDEESAAESPAAPQAQQSDYGYDQPSTSSFNQAASSYYAGGYQAMPGPGGYHYMPPDGMQYPAGFSYDNMVQMQPIVNIQPLDPMSLARYAPQPYGHQGGYHYAPMVQGGYHSYAPQPQQQVYESFSYTQTGGYGGYQQQMRAPVAPAVQANNPGTSKKSGNMFADVMRPKKSNASGASSSTPGSSKKRGGAKGGGASAQKSKPKKRKRLRYGDSGSESGGDSYDDDDYTG